MPTVLSEKMVVIKDCGDIKLSATLFEEFALVYGIPSIVVNQVRLILLEVLSAIHDNNRKFIEENKTYLTIKLFEQGSLSFKMVYKGVPYNPFEESFLGQNDNRFESDYKIGTLGAHLARKYMDVHTYCRSLDYNIIYLKKEQV